jgi:hypothetical protein
MLLAQTANARITENNVFIVLKVSLLTQRMRLSAGAITDCQLPQANRARKYPLAVFQLGDPA